METEIEDAINFCKEFYKKKKYKEFEKYLLKFIKDFPNNQTFLMFLAENYKNQNNFEDSEKIYLKLIKLNPNEALYYSVYGELLFHTNLTEKSIEIFNLALNINKNHVLSLYGKARSLNLLKDSEAAIHILNRAIALAPKFESALNLLASIYKRKKLYNQAYIYYSRIESFKKEKLECLYYLDKRDEFYNLLNQNIDKKEHCVSLATLSAHASIRYDKNDDSDFCKKPFKFIHKRNLIKSKILDTIFLNTYLKELIDNKVTFRAQNLIENSVQTQGNAIFDDRIDMGNFISIIDNEISLYLDKFKSNDRLIKDFPKDYNLNAWFLIMNDNGYVKPHIHDNGWISGSIYLNIPSKKDNNEGNIKFSYHNDDYPVSRKSFPEKIVELITGDIILFPSSLFHSTIPIKSDEKRVVLAFDVMHK